VKVFVKIFLFSIIVSSSVYTVFSLGSNLEKIQSNINVEFSEKEKKFLNSLSSTDLEKLKKIIQLITQQKNTARNSNSPISSFFNNTNTSQKPTTYSNSPSPTTPYYNPNLGQYQSTPFNGSPSSSSGSSGSSQPTSQGGNPFWSLPFSGTSPTGGQTPLQLANQTRPESVMQGIVNGLQAPPPGGTVDLSNLNILPQCKINYGVVNRGKCFDIENAQPHLKETTALACSAIGKPIGSASVVRGKQCPNSGVGSGSQHNHGKAIDVSQNGLTSEEKVKVYEVFRKRGYFGVGCYGLQGHVHFDNSPARRWYEGPCPPELRIAGY
jgi:hypothetical protein